MHFFAGGPQGEIARSRAPHPRGVPLLAAGVGRRIHFARYNQIMASSAPPSALPSAIDRARKIKIILFDVDGVLTDGTIWLVPGRPADGSVLDQIRGKEGQIGHAVHSDTMMEAKGYSAHDGTAISLAR